MPVQEGSDESQDRVEAAFTEFRDAWMAGKDLDPDTFCNEHSECGEALRTEIDNFLFVAERLPNPGWTDSGAVSEKSPREKEIPERFLGDYRLIREIGRGGMGVVYEAEQTSLRRKVALKVLAPHLGFSGEAVLKFRREAEAGGRQRHPGIVSVYGVGEHEGVHFIAEELVEGGRTLADMLEEFHSADNLPKGYFRKIAELMAFVARSLDHAHESGVIHRDIKPSNILLTQDESQPKVTDFGLAKIEDGLALSRTGDLSGTPYYMSPEQAMSKKKEIDRRTDIYSLGVTLYEILTLKPPFEGDTTHEILKKIVFTDPPAPLRVNPRVPRDLSIICLKAMEKPPERRYQTMKEFADDLDRYLSGDVILARPAGPGTRIWKRVKRNPVLYGAMGTAVLAVLVLLISLPLYAWNLKNRYDQVRRLSDERELSYLETKAEVLWPAHPGMIPEMKEWIRIGEELLTRLDGHKNTLIKLRKGATPYSEESECSYRESHPRFRELTDLEEVRTSLIERIELLEAKKSASISSPEQERDDKKIEKDIECLKNDLAVIEEKITSLEEEISRRSRWAFDETPYKWEHDLLADLVSELHNFTDNDDGTLKKVKDRLAFAERIEKLSILDHAEQWERAIASIADHSECPQYDELLIKPHIGLVPIGQDPDSRLWEFAHLQTGTIPVRGDDGLLRITEETGLVFVLIPGGKFWMGAQNKDRNKSNYSEEARTNEMPVHETELDPFFISKYEMTQGQWVRFTGKPSTAYRAGVKIGDKPITLINPIDKVTWNECREALFQLGLEFPTEAQWEYAARANTTTNWWTGEKKESIVDAGNLADQYLNKHSGMPDWSYDEWLNDGHVVHAPVDSFRPNPFGLHSVIGNVREWCLDGYLIYDVTPPRAGDGLRGASNNPLYMKMMRGGSYTETSSDARSAYRTSYAPDEINDQAGLRPAAKVLVQ